MYFGHVIVGTCPTNKCRNDDFHTFCRMLDGLTFLPVVDVEASVQYLKRPLPKDSLWLKGLPRLTSTTQQSGMGDASAVEPADHQRRRQDNQKTVSRSLRAWLAMLIQVDGRW